MNLKRFLSSAKAYELSCILQLGFGTMFMFIGLDTHSFILESVLHSVNSRDPNRIDQYAGYYGQALTMVAFALSNLFATSIIRRFNPKWSIFIGSVCSTVYYTGFQCINSYVFYITSFVAGVGCAIFFTGHGCYLTEHSEPKNMARNASLSWAIACLSFVSGGIILLVIFHNDDTSGSGGHRQFSEQLIRWIFGVFSVFCILSNVTFCFLRKKKDEANTAEKCLQKAEECQNDTEVNAKEVEKTKECFTDGIVSTLQAFGKPNVWWLSFSWLYLGITTSFMLGIFPTTLIFTESLSKSPTLIPFYSFSISLGELSTALIVSILSRKVKDFGRVPTAVIGFLAHFVVFILAFAFTPRYSSLRPNYDDGLLFKPNFYVAVVCGYLLGLADGCWNTVRCCAIPVLFEDDRAEGFSISKIFQSGASFAVFVVSPAIDMYAHLGILVAFNILALVTFAIASVMHDRRKRKIFHANLLPPNCNIIDAFPRDLKCEL